MSTTEAAIAATISRAQRYLRSRPEDVDEVLSDYSTTVNTLAADICHTVRRHQQLPAELYGGLHRDTAVTVTEHLGQHSDIVAQLLAQTARITGVIVRRMSSHQQRLREVIHDLEELLPRHQMLRHSLSTVHVSAPLLAFSLAQLTLTIAIRRTEAEILLLWLELDDHLTAANIELLSRLLTAIGSQPIVQSFTVEPGDTQAVMLPPPDEATDITDRRLRRQLDDALHDPTFAGDQRPWLESLHTTLQNHRQQYLLHFDPHTRTAAVAVGDPDTSVSIATIVPGVHSHSVEGLTGTTNWAQKLYHRTPNSCVIAWLGYPAPSNPAIALNTSGVPAAGQALNRFQRTLRQRRPTAHLTVMGYSYGGLVTGAAASATSEEPLEADHVMLLGTPGAGVKDATQLHTNAIDGHTDITVGRDPADFIGLTVGEYGGMAGGVDPLTDTFGADCRMDAHSVCDGAPPSATDYPLQLRDLIHLAPAHRRYSLDPTWLDQEAEVIAGPHY